MLQHMICCEWMVPQAIVRAKFGAHPLCLENMFKVIFFLHGIFTLGDSTSEQGRYPYLTLCSFEGSPP